MATQRVCDQCVAAIAGHPKRSFDVVLEVENDKPKRVIHLAVSPRLPQAHDVADVCDKCLASDLNTIAGQLSEPPAAPEKRNGKK